MKKILALLLLCAGLTATAAPQFNRANIVKSNKATTSMLLKTNSMASQFMAPATGKSSMTIQKFVRDNQVNLNENRLAKKAPMRVTEDLVLMPKLMFMEVFDWSFDENDSLVVESALPSFAGGWSIDLTAGDEAGVYTCDGLYYTLPQDFVVDMANNTVTMPTFVLLGSFSNPGSGRNRTDTVENIYIVNEKWFTENAEAADIEGQILDDGSFIFNDGFAYLFEDVLKTYVNNNLSSTDTTMALSAIFRNPYMMVPTGTHTYNFISKGKEVAGNNAVYMFQQNDTTVRVWNLWGFGGVGNVMNIYEDGSMIFPLQVIKDDDMSEYAAEYPNYQFSTNFFNFNGGSESVSDDSDTPGRVNGNKITWDSTTVSNFFVYNGNYYFPAVSYPTMYSNVLTLDNDVFYYEKSVAPVITYEVTDDAVIITAAGEGTVVLATQDGTPVDNPYTVERTDADQTIVMLALAQQEGKLVSEVVSMEIVVPAKEESFLRGDVNSDGAVNISDVTALIDYILSHDATGVNLNAADCNQDGGINISDVTALIDYILSHAW